MKISTTAKFPHPILNSDSQDYTNGTFSIVISATEVVSDGSLKINYTISLEEEKILKLVKAKKAKVGIFVTCLETYFNRLISLPELQGNVNFKAGTLKGLVQIKPMIWASEEISEYFNANLHPEFRDIVWQFDDGTLLALAEELTIYVGHEKLIAMESIFSLAKNDSVSPGTIGVQLQEDKITIIAHKELYLEINALRNTKEGKKVILNSVYLPAVMQILSELKEDEAQYNERKWFKIFNAKCQHLGVRYDSADFLESAQKLLLSPLSKLKSISEKL